MRDETITTIFVCAVALLIGCVGIAIAARELAETKTEKVTFICTPKDAR